jgi:SAM-dependent methyltransferase
MSETTPSSDFEPEPELYDALIDWPRRLEREAPFYRRLFEQHEVQSVLDAACGTGRHADMFHSWGLRVEGADVSPAMIAHCRGRWGEGDRLKWVVRPFDRPPERPAEFDAAICVGNSLAIVPDSRSAGDVLAAMIASLRPGGILVVQVLNLWRLAEGPTEWQKCKRLTDEQGDRILLKGIHRIAERGFVDVVSLSLGGNDVDSRFRTAMILGLEANELLATAERAGATDLRVFGDYQESPYDRERSQDLILVGRRAR